MLIPYLIWLACSLTLSLPIVHAESSSSQAITAVVVKHFPPHYMLDENGQTQGFAIDILNEIANLSNLKVTYLVKDNWKQTAKALTDGKAHLIPNLGITKNRQNQFDFTVPVEISPISIIVRYDSTQIRSKQDLSGKVVGVVQFNVGTKIVKKMDNVKFVIFDQPEAALIGLLAGRVDALVYPKSVMLKVARESGLEDRIKIVGKPLQEIRRAIAVHKGNTQLLNTLNVAIEKFSQSKGYERIFVKWYGKPKPFWTASKVLLTTLSIILISIILSVLWRYYTLIAINKHLAKTIEDRNQAELALEESNLLLENVLNSTPDLIFVKNKQLQTILCNSAYAKAVGKKPQEMYGLTDIENGWNPELIHGDSAKGIHGFEKDDKAALAGQGVHNPYDPANVEGDIRIFDTHKLPLFNSSEEIIGMLGVARDVTDRYRTEQSLTNLNRSLRALSACNEVLVRATDEDELLNKVCRIIVEISEYPIAWVGLIEHGQSKTIRPAAQVGYEENFLASRNFSWGDNEQGQEPGGTAIRTCKPCIIDDVHSDSRFAALRQQAIEHRYASIAGLPLLDGEKPIGVLLVYASEAHSFDEKEIHLLQKLADDLAFGIITLRSHQERHALNKQLQQAQKMEAIGQLTGGIAHDFNNILASILGFTSLALQRYVSDDQPELREYLNEVTAAGERARDLVSQMMAFSRIGSSKKSPLSLPPLIKEVTKMLQVTLPSSIQLSSQIDPQIPMVMMNPVNLQQVLMNMCINARDAIGQKGSISINVQLYPIESHQDLSQIRHCDSCHKEIDSGDYIELSVQDSGSGIADDMLKRIFEPFFTTKDVNKGTGMGLPMVHGIIHQHQGHILVDSKLGIGTTFRLLLPIEKPAENHKPNSAIKTSEKFENLNNTRILVVDDEVSIVRFMVDLFENRGSIVTAMTESQAALDLFTQNPMAFDLLITDQTMPVLTGVELAQKVLALRPNMPIILCTGFSENMDEATAKIKGIQGYIAKPMEVNVLFNLAQSLIN